MHSNIFIFIDAIAEIQSDIHVQIRGKEELGKEEVEKKKHRQGQYIERKKITAFNSKIITRFHIIK